jgi:transposase-like protein
MTTREQLIRARLGLLAMATELKNIAKACKLAGVSRSQFYAMRKAYERYGKEGLAPRVRRKPEMPNRTPPPLEEQILMHTRKHPLSSYVRLAREIECQGGSVTPTMVRYVWQRHGLSTQSARRAWVKVLNSRSRLKATKDVPSEALGKPLQGEYNHDAASMVDWTYWSDRVRESLTK